MKKSKLVCLFILSLFTLSLVSAYGGWGGFSPANLLDNEWAVFGIIFVVFFAVIFLSLGKVFKDNHIVAGVISAALALLIAASASKRYLFYGYFGENLGNLILLLALLLALGFLFRLILGILTIIGAMIFLDVTWLFLGFADTDFLYNLLPYNFADMILSAAYPGEGFFWFVLMVLGSITAIVIWKYPNIKEHFRKKKFWEVD